jgi:hypothetical protein
MKSVNVLKKKNKKTLVDNKLISLVSVKMLDYFKKKEG